MSAFLRISLFATAITWAVGLHAADLPKESPFASSGPGNPTSAQNDPLEFAGVSTVGEKTMIDLFDRQQKHSIWVQVGQSAEGITVVAYDSTHDQVRVRQNGTERTLALRAQTTVSGPAIPAPVAALPVSVPSPEPSGPMPAASTSTASDSSPATAQTRARQEEEARMLVSDLLEIGIVQRKAYEDAQKRLASGQPAQPSPPATSTSSPSAPPSQPAGNTSSPTR